MWYILIICLVYIRVFVLIVCLPQTKTNWYNFDGLEGLDCLQASFYVYPVLQREGGASQSRLCASMISIDMVSSCRFEDWSGQSMSFLHATYFYVQQQLTLLKSYTVAVKWLLLIREMYHKNNTLQTSKYHHRHLSITHFPQLDKILQIAREEYSFKAIE